MSVETVLSQATSAITNAVSEHRAQLSNLTAIGDVNHRFGFIQGIESALNLFKQIAQPFLNCAGQGTASTVVGAAVDTADTVLNTVDTVASDVSNLLNPPAQEPAQAVTEAAQAPAEAQS